MLPLRKAPCLVTQRQTGHVKLQSCDSSAQIDPGHRPKTRVQLYPNLTEADGWNIHVRCAPHNPHIIPVGCQGRHFSFLQHPIIARRSLRERVALRYSRLRYMKPRVLGPFMNQSSNGGREVLIGHLTPSSFVGTPRAQNAVRERRKEHLTSTVRSSRLVNGSITA